MRFFTSNRSSKSAEEESISTKLLRPVLSCPVMPCRVMVCTTIIRTAILAFLVVIFTVSSMLHQPNVVVVVVAQYEMDATNELPILGRLMKTT